MKILLLLAPLALLGSTVAAEEAAELGGGDVASRPPHWMGVDYYCTMVDCWVCVAGFNDPEHCHKQYFKKRLIPSHRRNHSLAGSSNDVDGNKTVHLCVMDGCYVCTLPARTDCHFEPFQRAADASPVRLGALQRTRSNCNETMCWYCMGLGNCAARGDCCVYQNVLQARPAALFSAAPEEQKSVSCHTLNGVKTCTVCDERSGACRTTTSGGGDEPEQQPAWPEYTNCNATHCWLCMGVSPCGERGDCCKFVHLLPDRSNCNATHCWECRLGCALFSRHCGGCTFVPIFGPKRVGREAAAAAEEEQNENYHTESDDDATGGGKKREADSVEDQYWADGSIGKKREADSMEDQNWDDGSIGKKREADSMEDQNWDDGSIGKKREAIRARREEADFD